MAKGAYAELIDACRTVGSHIDAPAFAEACRQLAHDLDPEYDRGLVEHVERMVSQGERMAAVWTVLPETWGRRVARDCDRTITACVALPNGRGWQEEVTSDEEGAALLGALAAAVAKNQNVTRLR